VRGLNRDHVVHDVLQLPDVAGIVVRLEYGQDLFAYVRDPLADDAVVSLQEVVRQQIRNCFRTGRD